LPLRLFFYRKERTELRAGERQDDDEEQELQDEGSGCGRGV